MARDRDARGGAVALPASAAGTTRAWELAAELRHLAADLEAQAAGKDRVVEPDATTGLAAFARGIHASRRMLDRLLGNGISADPVLDILLAMFAAGEEGTSLSVDEGCAAAELPLPTGRRWLALLMERALVCEARPLTPGDPAGLSLTAAGREAVHAYLAAVGQYAPAGMGSMR